MDYLQVNIYKGSYKFTTRAAPSWLDCSTVEHRSLSIVEVMGLNPVAQA